MELLRAQWRSITARSKDVGYRGVTLPLDENQGVPILEALSAGRINVAARLIIDAMAEAKKDRWWAAGAQEEDEAGRWWTGSRGDALDYAMSDTGAWMDLPVLMTAEIAASYEMDGQGYAWWHLEPGAPIKVTQFEAILPDDPQGLLDAWRGVVSEGNFDAPGSRWSGDLKALPIPPMQTTAAKDEQGFLGYRGLLLRRSEVEGRLGRKVEDSSPEAVSKAILGVLGSNVGQHWTTVLGVAISFALPVSTDTLSVVLVAAIPDRSVDRTPPGSAVVYQGSDEFERYLKSGARVELAKVCYLTSSPGKWVEVPVSHLPPVKALKTASMSLGDVVSAKHFAKESLDEGLLPSNGWMQANGNVWPVFSHTDLQADPDWVRIALNPEGDLNVMSQGGPLTEDQVVGIRTIFATALCTSLAIDVAHSSLMTKGDYKGGWFRDIRARDVDRIIADFNASLTRKTSGRLLTAAWYHEIESAYRHAEGLIGAPAVARSELDALLVSILSHYDVPNAEYAYTWPNPHGDAYTSMIGWDHDGVMVPVVFLGSGMQDQLTVCHEAAHLIDSFRSGWWGRPRTDTETAHGDEWAKTFVEILARFYPKAYGYISSGFRARKGSG